MKYFKDENNEAWAYEDDVKPEQIKAGLISIIETEFNAITNPPLTQEQLDAIDKSEMLTALSNLTITTTAGNTFDADDTARADMQSAITAADTLSLTEHNWKLADNTWKIISLAELKEASALAIQAKGAILAGV